MKKHTEHHQKTVPLITEADLEAFSMKRFLFAQASENQTVASTLKLLEEAMGTRKAELAAIYGQELFSQVQQQTGTQDDGVVW